MKIVHIISGLKIGGAEQALLRLIIGSNKLEFNHIVISLSGEGELCQLFINANIDLRIINFKKKPVSSFFVLIKIIAQTKPDIVQTWLYHADLIGGITAKIAGVKHIIWGIRTTDLKKGSYSTALVRKINAWLSFSLPSKIVCVAESAKARHVKLGYCESKMLIIPNGFDLDKLHKYIIDSAQLRLKHGIKQNEIVIGSMGRFSQIKGQDVFVKAAKIVAENNPNVRFLMVGRELQESNKPLMKWITNTGFVDRFVLLGERLDVNICFGAMNIFCLHSRSEGFPNVLGEAMAMGLPCVATDVGDAKILGGELVKIVEPDNPEVLALALMQMLNFQSKKLNELGKLSNKRIFHMYSLSTMQLAYQGLYNNILLKKSH